MKSKVRVNAMKDAAVLSKDQQRMRARMRHKHGVTIKANPPVYDPTDRVEHEQHFTPSQIAKQWGLSVYTVRRMFADVPGVLKIGQKGKHVSLRIPGRLLRAYHAKLSACRAEVHADRNQDRGAKAEIRINITRS